VAVMVESQEGYADVDLTHIYVARELRTILDLNTLSLAEMRL